MRRFAAACLCVLLAACARIGPRGPNVDHRVLFVGNSLTYYNDLPRIVQAMYAAARPGHAVEVDLLAEGGAKIADHLREGRWAELLAERRYDLVVLQDLGGFPACADDFPGCRDAIASVCEATRLVRAGNAEPILFGTWQGVAQFQKALSEATREEARRCGLNVVADTGAAMQRFRGSEVGTSPWLDDGHPALAGSWVAAATLTRAILGSDLRADLAIAPFCRARWQGAELSLRQLAASQRQPERDCAMPPDGVVRAAFEAANANEE